MQSNPLGLILISGLLAWQLPTIIGILTGRYESAYLPRAKQALAARDQITILPTAAVTIDTTSGLANGLLANDGRVDDVSADFESLSSAFDTVCI